MIQNIVRAEARIGKTIKYLPFEWTGDPKNTDSILAYYDFGFELVEKMKRAGFSNYISVVYYAPGLGLLPNNCPVWTNAEKGVAGNMLPTAVLAKK